jgi:HPt (histidine-containing phosphotransfer) domain-containing protein
MFYITNENGWLIAADDTLLQSMGYDTIEALQTALLTGKAELPQQERAVPLQSMFGRWSVVMLHEQKEAHEEMTVPSETFEFVKEENEEKLLEKLDLVEDAATGEEEIPSDEEVLELFTEKSEVKPEAPSEEVQETKESTPAANDELIDLLLPTEGEVRVETLEEEEKPKTALTTEAPTPKSTVFDIEHNAKEIGVSVQDYHDILTEYLQKIKSVQGQLKTSDDVQRHNTVSELLHLAHVLRLEHIAERLESLTETPSDENVEKLIETLEIYLGKEATDEQFVSETKPENNESGELFELDVDTDKTSSPEKETYLYDTIDLHDVEPIHFDFTIEEAAQDLSLPADLIEEFIQDFIKQAHEETERMIEAYRKGDLETVQKIGHLLKGTSSNLRITPLADTLYEIQFNDDIKKVPELVRNYWAHFLSLENQMKLISKQ